VQQAQGSNLKKNNRNAIPTCTLSGAMQLEDKLLHGLLLKLGNKNFHQKQSTANVHYN